jgi:hypothetical protein
MKQFSAKTKSSSFRLEECEEINVFKNILFWEKCIYKYSIDLYRASRTVYIYSNSTHNKYHMVAGSLLS